MVREPSLRYRYSRSGHKTLIPSGTRCHLIDGFSLPVRRFGLEVFLVQLGTIAWMANNHHHLKYDIVIDPKHRLGLLRIETDNRVNIQPFRYCLQLIRHGSHAELEECKITPADTHAPIWMGNECGEDRSLERPVVPFRECLT